VSIPRLQSTTLNGPVVAFTLGLAVLSAIVFGLVPAQRASRTHLQTTFREGGRDSRRASRDRLRGVLVISELCLAQILLIGAGLLIRSGMNIQAVPPGFDTNNVLAVSVGLPRARYKELAEAEAALRQMESAIAAVPGVKAVGFSQVAPIYGNGWNWTAFREGSNTHDEGATGADMRSISATYFTALGQKLLRGRAFTITDGPTAPRVAIISRGLAMKLFGSIDVVGRRVSNGNLEHPDWMEIVGVADDVHGNGLAEEPYPALYMPTQQWPQNNTTFVVRGNVPVTTLMPDIRRAIGGVDPLVPLSNVMTMEAAVGRHLAYSRFNSWLLGLLGATGLVLAIIGVYGVVSYFVTQRSRELGVRLALGASDGSVRWLVVRQGLTLAMIGVAVGVPLALAATRLLSSFMFGITPHDPLTFAAVGGLLALVVIAASYIPARRATRIDPLEALRSS
jgi:predicted permease